MTSTQYFTNVNAKEPLKLRDLKLDTTQLRKLVLDLLEQKLRWDAECSEFAVNCSSSICPEHHIFDIAVQPDKSFIKIANWNKDAVEEVFYHADPRYPECFFARIDEILDEFMKWLDQHRP